MREGSNGFDAEVIGRYLDEIDDADDELLKLKSEHMLACKPVRARIKNTMKEARNAGLNMEAFRTVIAEHRANRKIDERIAELEEDDRQDYEAMRQALGKFGDTPLGSAALQRAKQREETLTNLNAG
jgi:uncharacterized protein (UPF0335 family)